MQHRFGDCTTKVESELHEWAAGHDINTADREVIREAMLERGRVLSDDEIRELLQSQQIGGQRS